MDDLVDAAARALTPVALPYIEGYEEVPPEHVWTRPRYEWLSLAMVQMAKAIIPIVYEDAAKVAAQSAVWDGANNCCSATADSIAEAIRSRSMTIVGES